MNSPIFDQADKLIYGQRQADYGSPRRNINRIAELWDAYLRAKYNGDARIDGNDVCAMMRLMKEARLMQTPTHEDTLVDVCGYAGVQYRINFDRE